MLYPEFGLKIKETTFDTRLFTAHVAQRLRKTQVFFFKTGPTPSFILIHSAKSRALLYVADAQEILLNLNKLMKRSVYYKWIFIYIAPFTFM